MGDLERQHLVQLAPLMLGGMAWDTIRWEHFDCWVTFKAAVERTFGLTRQQLEDAFFSMVPAASESTDAFILRVESRRVRHSIDENTCYRSFLRVLPVQYRAELDRISNYAVAMGNN